MAKRISWAPQARADLRAIEQKTAMDILHSLGRFATTEVGDVKMLKSIKPPEFRLRIGNYRVRFYDHGDSIEILRVRHRREVYR